MECEWGLEGEGDATCADNGCGGGGGQGGWFFGFFLLRLGGFGSCAELYAFLFRAIRP